MWELLSNTKRKCWNVWLVFTGITVVISLIQTLSGRLNDIEGFSWIWVGLNLIPGFLLVFISYLKDRRTANMVPTAVHNILWMGSLLYLLLLMATLLLEGLATADGWSIYEYRLRSLSWTMPTQGFMVVGYLLIFFRREPIFRPDDTAIEQFAIQQAEKWGKQQEELKRTCSLLISESKIAEVFPKAKELIERKGIGDLNYLIILESQFKKVENDFMLNLIPYDEYQRMRNRISQALLNLINTL